MYETPSDIIRIARDIAGKDADQEQRDWVAQHIESNTEAVQSGKHDIIYYPGSGRDAIRALVAYDARHVIAVEYYKDYTTPLEDFKDFNIRELPTGDENRREFVFDYNGAERRITEIVGDARLVDPKEIAGRRPDILHIYTPSMGPYDDLGDKAVLSKISSDLSEENYRMIEVGGFFIFDESSISVSSCWTRADKELAALYGLEELRTVKRNPYRRFNFTMTVPDKEKGYIYKKNEEISQEVFMAAQDARGLMYLQDYVLGCLREGEPERIFFEPRDDYAPDVRELFHGILTQADEVVSACVTAGIPREKCTRFRKAFEDDLLDRLAEIFLSYKEFLAVVGDKKTGPVTEEELKPYGFVCFSVPEDAHSYSNAQWPFATHFLSDRKLSDEHYELWWDSDSSEAQDLLSIMKKMSLIQRDTISN